MAAPSDNAGLRSSSWFELLAEEDDEVAPLGAQHPPLPGADPPPAGPGTSRELFKSSVPTISPQVLDQLRSPPPPLLRPVFADLFDNILAISNADGSGSQQDVELDRL